MELVGTLEIAMKRADRIIEEANKGHSKEEKEEKMLDNDSKLKLASMIKDGLDAEEMFKILKMSGGNWKIARIIEKNIGWSGLNANEKLKILKMSNTHPYFVNRV